MNNAEIKKQIEEGRTVLGIELGSTRIKSVLVGEDHRPIAEGAFTWENQLVDGIWTYDLKDVLTGLQESYADLSRQIRQQYQTQIRTLAGIGISAMMHGYLAFDEKDRLLTPFRTWRNTITKEAAEELTELFSYNIPQRWSIAHLYQAILNDEPHVDRIRSVMTLAAYVHWQLTGRKVIGIGDASGMFPINLETKTYDEEMVRKFDALERVKQRPWKLLELLPKTLMAGEDAGQLTKAGAALLDRTGELSAGCLICPPEGDAQTGMVATNAVRVGTGNVSAGTSDFAILVLERELSKVYTEIDLVTSPTGALAANVHCNNCTTDINAWVRLFGEAAALLGASVDPQTLYERLFTAALEGDADCGGILTYNYYSGEGITDLDAGRPLMIRQPDASFTLANVMRTHLYSSLATLALGMEIITKQEGMSFDRIMGHGGLFKTPKAGQTVLSAALGLPVTVMETASYGGAWGIALLARYACEHPAKSLEDWLDEEVFAGESGSSLCASKQDIEGFSAFLERYRTGLSVERKAVEVFS